jgi:hypothetical protein
VSLCLYSDSRAQGLGGTSGIPKDRGLKQLEGRKEEDREKQKRKREEMKSFKTDLSFSILKRRLV